MDRSDYLGDPDFNNLPLKQMANPKYAAAWRTSIDPSKPTPSKDLVRPAGFLPPPPSATTTKESTETTHFSIVDSEGNAVSSTTTLNGGFGSGVLIHGLGFLMNNEMDDFTSKIGVPNMFGLIQSSANSIAPGKRPLSAMTPTIITTHGSFFHHAKLAYVMGTPGGSTIITTVANDVISAIDNHLNIQAVADAPRFHHQYIPTASTSKRSSPTTSPINSRPWVTTPTATRPPTTETPASGATANSSPSIPKPTNFSEATTTAATSAKPLVIRN